MKQGERKKEKWYELARSSAGYDGDCDSDTGGAGRRKTSSVTTLALALGNNIKHTFSVGSGLKRRERKMHRRHSHTRHARRRCGRRCWTRTVTALSIVVAILLLVTLVFGCVWVYGTDWDTEACDDDLLSFSRWFLYLLWIGWGAIGCYLVLLVIVILAEVKGMI